MTKHRKLAGELLVLAAALVAALVATGLASARAGSRTIAARVTVVFTNTTLRVTPTSPESGLTTFVVHNKGRKAHVLEITGPGLKKGVRTKPVAGGHTAQVTVTLRAGMYELSDPVGLGVYSAQYLDIIPATKLSATGTSSVVNTPPPPPPMCGMTYTP